MISICIPCKDDHIALDRTIKSIQKTIDKEFEIIICDDGSREPVKRNDCKVIRHKNTIGVGAAIDTAVKHANFDIIAISGADIIHKNDNWASKCISYSLLEPNTIFNSVTVGYKPELDEFAITRRYGAEIIIKADIKDIPLSRRFAYPDNWRMLYRSKWNQTPKTEVSSLLGAFYIVQKKWYNYLKGFQMHRRWGSLDSYLAMKSWLAGGKCKIMEDVTTGHEFKIGKHQPIDWLYYNKALVTRTLFPYQEKELLEWMNNKFMIKMGVDMLNSYMDKSYELTEYLQNIFIHDLNWYIKKFNLK
jgi:glycosyltransferase involved in cell wall biosynthesis